MRVGRNGRDFRFSVRRVSSTWEEGGIFLDLARELGRGARILDLMDELRGGRHILDVAHSG